MSMIYRDTVKILPHSASIDDVEEYLRGIAWNVEVDPEAKEITFELRGDDLWDIHEWVSEVEIELGSRCVDFMPDKSKAAAFGITVSP